MTLDAETAAWSDVQGDVWARSYTRSTGSRTYDAATLLVQLRNTDTGALVASSKVSEQTGGVLAIDTSDTDFSGNPYTFAWKISSTAGIAASKAYVIEAQCEVDGDLHTFYSHAWECREQWAAPV